MKTIQVHPFSLVLGALASAAMLALLGMADPARRAPAERILGIPAPSDIIRIEPKEPYKVPEGKVFVALGVILVEGQAANNEVIFDKETVFRVPGGGSSSIPGPGIVAAAGTKVSIKQKGSYLTGYLADE